MPNLVNSILTLIASPGDAMQERATVRDALNDWSVTNGPRQGVMILPWLYERHAVAGLGGRAQAIINTQAVDKADVVIAFFDSRLGTDTGLDVSGTAEEIHRALSLNKPVHVYFSSEPLSRDTDPAQLTKLNEFKESLRSQGLLGDYTDPGDLASQVRRALEADIDENRWSEITVIKSQLGARLLWKHDLQKEQSGIDRNGRVKMRTTRSRLIVKNGSDVDAESLTFTVQPAPGSGGQLLRSEIPSSPATLHAQSELQWLLIPDRSMTLQIDAQWTENGVSKSKTTTISAQT